MKKIFFSFVLIYFLACFAFATDGDVTFSGEVETSWAVCTPWANEVSWKDSDIAGHFTAGDTLFRGKLDAYYGEASAFFQGEIGYDAVTNEMLLELGELYADYSSSFWGIRIGRQKVVWGKADGIDITNVITPCDLSSFSRMTSDDNLLALDSVRLSFNTDSFTADLYWIPFFTPSRLPFGNSIFGIAKKESSLRKYILPQSVDFSIAALGTTLTLPVTIDSIERPEIAIQNGEYAVKLSGYFSALDFSLYGFYGWDDIPFFGYEIKYGQPNLLYPALPEEILVRGEYKHLAMCGLDMAIPIKEVVLRLEGAAFPFRNFQKSAEKLMEENASGLEMNSSLERHQVSGLLGLDWMPSNWVITAQYFFNYVFGDVEPLKREKNFEHGATLSISDTLLQETLELSLSAVMNFNDFDSMINPSISYNIVDGLEFSCGAYVFLPGPKADGEYGKYKDLTSVYIKAQYAF